MTQEQRALTAVGRWLRDAGYTFTTVTPDTKDASMVFAGVNVALAGLSDRVELVQGDLYVAGTFDTVVANPAVGACIL
jgi:methylase of polypeptide subunit release factors